MIIDPALAYVDPLRRAVRDNIRADEAGIVARLVDEAALAPPVLARVAARSGSTSARAGSMIMAGSGPGRAWSRTRQVYPRSGSARSPWLDGHGAREWLP